MKEYFYQIKNFRKIINNKSIFKNKKKKITK